MCWCCCTSFESHHTNHPLTDIDQAAGDQPNDTANSCARHDFIAARAGSIRTQADVEALLADQSVPISIAHEPGRIFTFGATSMALTSPPQLRIAPGPPHSKPFVNLSFEL